MGIERVTNRIAPWRFAVFGAGFIGLNLVRALLENGEQVAVLDHNDPPAHLSERVRWTRGEFADPKAVERTLDGATVAFHLVSSTVPGDEHIDVTRELSENIFTTLKFLDVCEHAGVRRIVFVSSSSVYGLQDVIPIPESAATDPISSHGIQKLAIEKYLLLHRFHQGLEVRVARLSNPFGPGQRLFGRQGFIALTVGHLLKDEPLLVRDEGRPVRDFIYIDDVTRALHRLATCEEAPPVLNVGSGIGHSLRQVVSVIEDSIGRCLKLELADHRRTDIPVSVLDVTLARDVIGFEAAIALPDGIRRTLRHHGIALRKDPP
jgi:UDP-glucose 4-epimerase